MLVIRLQRNGRRNSPSYRMVVTEHSAPVQGRSVEILGHYLPAREPAVLDCNTERVSFWVKRGARPSNTVARLLQKSGMTGLDLFIESYSKQKPKKESESAQSLPPQAVEKAKEDAAEVKESVAEERAENGEADEIEEVKEKKEGDKPGEAV